VISQSADWRQATEPQRSPKLFNLRTDPYERADITFSRYCQWIVENAYKLAAALTSGH
jgi:hypothetical protein